MPPGVFTATVFDLLRLLSIAYSPPAATAFWPTARWGLLRYFWAFGAPHPSGLRLSAMVATLPTRLKGLLAEDFGVALAQRLVPDLVPVPPGATTAWVNGELALGGAAVGPFGVVPLAGPNAGPDYFLVVTNGAIVTPYAVEAKGTTGTAWVRQMRHAAQQLSAIQLQHAAGGPAFPPAGFAVSSELTPSGIAVRVLDPEGDWSGPVGVRRPSERPAEQATTSREGPQLTVRDPEAFRRDLIDLSEAQLLGYAGLAAQATRRLPSRVRLADTEDIAVDAPLSEEATDYGDFRGISVRGRLPGTELEAFYGVEREILAALPDDDPVTATAARQAWTSRVRSRNEQRSWTSVDTAGRTYDAFGDDGSLLRVRLHM